MPSPIRQGSRSTLPQPTVPPLPPGWKEVTHERFAVDVPADWTVTKWQPTCGVQAPTVYLGPEGERLDRCTTYAYGAQVDIGAFVYQGPQTPIHTEINGLDAYVVVTRTDVAGPPTGTVTRIWVKVTSTVGALGLYIVSGESADFPGGGPGMAEKIEGTIHLAVAGSG